MKKPNYKKKICNRCKREYLPVGPNQWYCMDCRVEGRKEHAQFDKEKWLVDNAELIRQKDRERSQRPERKQYIAGWIAEHPDQVRESALRSGRKWSKNNLDWARIRNQRRRAQMLNSVPADKALTLEQWNNTVEYFDHRCAYCGRRLEKLTIDHIVPISQGGQNAQENVVPACQRCNGSKNDSSLLVYLLRRSYGNAE